MRGGGYNRVACITLIGQSNEVDSEMILRVPRWGDVPDQDVINKEFVNKHLDCVPTAAILAYDFSESNPLKSPYILQNKPPGHDLESKAQSYPSLTHQQKLHFVKEFCQLLLGMQKIQHPWIGQFSRSNEGFTVSPFDTPSEDHKVADERAAIAFFKPSIYGADIDEDGVSADPIAIASAQAPLRFFEIQFARWQKAFLGPDPSEIWEATIWHKLVAVTKEMDEHDCLWVESYCLTHYDLDPRNIMVEIVDEVPKITGIVDWDLACFAPDWVFCKPPMWIWNWADGDNEDESKAGEEPPTPEQRELKKLFDEFMGEDFTYNAYQPHLLLARDMFLLARFGLPSKELLDKAEKVPQRWEEWKEWYKQKQDANVQDLAGVDESADHEY